MLFLQLETRVPGEARAIPAVEVLAPGSWTKRRERGKSLKQFAHCKIKAYLLVTTAFEFGRLLQTK